MARNAAFEIIRDKITKCRLNTRRSALPDCVVITPGALVIEIVFRVPGWDVLKVTPSTCSVALTNLARCRDATRLCPEHPHKRSGSFQPQEYSYYDKNLGVKDQSHPSDYLHMGLYSSLP